MLPVLLLLMFGTFQTGLLMFSYNVMINAARDTARAMAVCTITDATTATNQVLKNLPAWVPASGWTITPTFGSDVSVTVSVDPPPGSDHQLRAVQFRNVDCRSNDA